MAKTHEKRRAQEMRHRGKSIREIAKILSVSKSSVSHWCRDISLTKTQQERLTRNRYTKGVGKLLENAEKRRAWHRYHTELYTEKGKQDLGTLSKRDRFLIGLALYWGAGYRKGNDEVGFASSDPAIIQFMVQWFIEQYGVVTPEFILRVSVNAAHEDGIDTIEQYWSEITRIPRNQFTKPSFTKNPSKKVRVNENAHMGTLRIKIRRSTNIKRRILGSSAALADSAAFQF